ncbi:MAG: hypothetical protein ACLP4V_02675 [Methylocella sp.]
MPVLRNARHERFAQELAKGKSAGRAYSLAGYSPNRGNYVRLKANESIRARVEEILAKSEAHAVVTIEMLTAMLIEDRALARERGQAAAAKGAVDSLAKLHGFMNKDKLELSGGMTLEQLVMASYEAEKSDGK